MFKDKQVKYPIMVNRGFYFLFDLIYRGKEKWQNMSFKQK